MSQMGNAFNIFRSRIGTVRQTPAPGRAQTSHAETYAFCDANIQRREMMARQQQDRADAIGYRAVSEMDLQIASGLPATPQMWADW